MQRFPTTFTYLIRGKTRTHVMSMVLPNLPFMPVRGMQINGYTVENVNYDSHSERVDIDAKAREGDDIWADQARDLAIRDGWTTRTPT